METKNGTISEPTFYSSKHAVALASWRGNVLFLIVPSFNKIVRDFVFFNKCVWIEN
ncbi:hypothetical protein SAMN05444355_10579 [Flavobacterium frigoris]|uniref:Uncharacterized protein n=1 Tax=Flavobacterium frigoris TaxID=229204 RepID=A0A1H9JWD1_FLAFI|nr:hypothetical protein SAMN05444355_10579 [Flavobacterium frigoris]